MELRNMNTKQLRAYMSYDDCANALDVFDTLSGRLSECEKKLNVEQNAHAELQSRCYEGYPSVSDGVFDYVQELKQQVSQLSTQMAVMAEAIKQALADSESGNGWGPDITVVYYLQKAISNLPASSQRMLEIMKAAEEWKECDDELYKAIRAYKGEGK